MELPFKDVPLLAELDGKPLGSEYPETSIGWYRRAFDLSASDDGKRVAAEFDGVLRRVQVMVNGGAQATQRAGARRATE